MKRFGAILLVFVIITSSLQDLITFATFKANQDYIATHLCVNRLDKIPRCQGSCYLQNKIASEHKDDLDGIPAPNLQDRLELVYLVSSKAMLPMEQDADAGLPLISKERALLSANHTRGIFRPPIFF